MRCATAIITAMALTLTAWGVLPAAELDKEFLNKPWGAPASDFTGYVNVGVNGKLSYFIHPRQAYTLFDTRVSELVYGFYEDAFFAVYVSLEAIDTYSHIKRHIQQKYGLPKISMESRGGLTTYSWKTGEARIKMKYFDDSGAMKLAVYFMPIAGRANLELQREMDAEPPEPLFPLSQTRQREAIELLDLFSY